MRDLLRRWFEYDRRVTYKYGGPRPSLWLPLCLVSLGSVVLAVIAAAADDYGWAVIAAFFSVVAGFKAGFTYNERLRELRRQSRFRGFRRDATLEAEMDAR